jgi:hypothetical protein
LVDHWSSVAGGKAATPGGGEAEEELRNKEQNGALLRAAHLLGVLGGDPDEAAYAWNRASTPALSDVALYLCRVQTVPAGAEEEAGLLGRLSMFIVLSHGE